MDTSSITDNDIRVFRAESRATGDSERSRAACAALGLPTGDGALGLLDQVACRERVAEIILREHTPGTSAARQPSSTVITVRVVHLSVFQEGSQVESNRGPHLQAIGLLPSGQELIRSRIFAGHSPSVRESAVEDVIEWLQANRRDWRFEVQS